MKMQLHFENVKMVQAYYKKYLTDFPGRGLPDLINKDILVSVLCAEVNQLVNGGADSGDFAEVRSSLEKLTKLTESLKETVQEQRSAIKELKSELNQLKNEVKMGKIANKDKKRCAYCEKVLNLPASAYFGHTEAECHKKAAAIAAGEDV